MTDPQQQIPLAPPPTAAPGEQQNPLASPPKAASDAYPMPTREEKKRITTMYLVGLKKGRLQDKLFDRDPRLSDLEQATSAAYDEWARARYRERAMHELHQEHEPMEMDGMCHRN